MDESPRSVVEAGEGVARGIASLGRVGQDVWLDDLNRRLLQGDLVPLIRSGVSGVTNNPTIFAAAVSESDLYDEDVRQSEKEGEELYWDLLVSDTQKACDLFLPLHQHTFSQGWVSLEVSPALAHDSAATVASALELSGKVSRENLLVKVPATEEGLEAIEELTRCGVSVNVTLIFSLARYRDVVGAYTRGLERRASEGGDLSQVTSVASFFVSRVDAMVDKELEELGREDLLGRVGSAQGWCAHRLFEEEMASEQWRVLQDRGANPQRVLWASTGVKSERMDPLWYVKSLALSRTISTMPRPLVEKVLPGEFTRGGGDGRAVLREVASAGVDMVEVAEKLEKEGEEKFILSYHEGLETVKRAVAEIRR